MQILEGIADIADRYDGYVLDLWGVVHDGRQPYPGVPEALAVEMEGDAPAPAADTDNPAS